MKVLVFDTETTGLPQKNEKGFNPSIYETSSWPYIVQLSYILYDNDKNKILVKHDHIIKIPPFVTISEKSIEIHKITKERSQKEGIDIFDALELFNICVIQADIIIAHNLSFDKQMILVECIRNRISGPFKMKNQNQYYCTMKNSVDICKIREISKINNKPYFKYPKLNELHNHLFGHEVNNTHNALVDIIICLRCFIKIHDNIDICNKCRKFNSLFKKLTN